MPPHVVLLLCLVKSKTPPLAGFVVFIKAIPLEPESYTYLNGTVVSVKVFVSVQF